MKAEQEIRNICDQMVQAMVGEKFVESWWASPNQAFDGRTPEEQWSAGSDQVINYLMHHAFSGGGS
jgi:hypothetical protein